MGGSTRESWHIKQELNLNGTKSYGKFRLKGPARISAREIARSLGQKEVARPGRDEKTHVCQLHKEWILFRDEAGNQIWWINDTFKYKILKALRLEPCWRIYRKLGENHWTGQNFNTLGGMALCFLGLSPRHRGCLCPSWHEQAQGPGILASFIEQSASDMRGHFHRIVSNWSTMEISELHRIANFVFNQR